MGDTTSILKVTKQEIVKIVPDFKNAKTIISTATNKATSENTGQEQVAAFSKAVTQIRKSIGRDGLLLVTLMEGSTAFASREILIQELLSGNHDKDIVFLKNDSWMRFQRLAIRKILWDIDKEKGIPQILKFVSDLNLKKVVTVKNRMGQVINQELKTQRVSNYRTNKLVTEYLLDEINEFRAVKYRPKLKKAFRHIYSKTVYGLLSELSKKVINGDILKVNEAKTLEKHFGLTTQEEIKRFCVIYRFITGDLLDAKEKDTKYINKELETIKSFNFIRKYFDVKNASSLDELKKATGLPAEIYHGLLSDAKHPLYLTLFDKLPNLTKSGKPKEDKPFKYVMKEDIKKLILELSKTSMTADQQMRMSKQFENLDVKKTTSVSDVKDVNILYKTKYEGAGDIKEINKAIKEKAKIEKLNIPYDNGIIILDKTRSMLGNQQESKNTPRAIAEYSTEVLKQSLSTHCVVESYDGDLGEALINGLSTADKNVDSVWIVSDGFEVNYDGKLNEVIEILKGDINYSNLSYLHISPVLSSDGNLKVKPLSEHITSFGISKPKEIEAKINLNKLELNPYGYFSEHFMNYIER